MGDQAFGQFWETGSKYPKSQIETQKSLKSLQIYNLHHMRSYLVVKAV